MKLEGRALNDRVGIQEDPNKLEQWIEQDHNWVERDLSSCGLDDVIKCWSHVSKVEKY